MLFPKYTRWTATHKYYSIEISDEAISWATQPVDSLTVYRLRSVLWPSALARSFWNFTKVLVVDDTKRIAGMLGIRTKAGPSMEQLINKQQQMMKGSLPNKKVPSLPPQAEAEGQATSNAKAMIKISASAKTRLRERENPQTPPEKTEETEVGPGTRTAMALHQHFRHAITVFRTKLKQTWRPAPSYPPRGSILVSGMVELEAPKAYLVFDVRGAWDPQTKAYDPRSMHLQLRRFQWKAQGPVA